MAAEWPEVSRMRYTRTQEQKRLDEERAAREDLKRRIAERPQEDVDATVEVLRQLLALSQIADLRIQLAWGFRDNGSVSRHVLSTSGYYTDASFMWRGKPRYPGNAERPQGPIQSFKLTQTGLVYPGPGHDQWVQVDPMEHADIVRRFNIHSGQLKFLIAQITA